MKNPPSPPSCATFHWHSGENLRWLILCDHASNHIPPEFGNLGVNDFQLQRHVAWDAGAADVARRLAHLFGAPWIEHAISRLVIDGNRTWDDSDLIPDVSDDVDVPGNRGLTATERRSRWDRYHQPYHQRIAEHLDHLRALSIRPMVVSVHSFTPELGRIPGYRKWPVGVLWRTEEAIAQALIRELARDGRDVGNNQPYSGLRMLGYTMERHAIDRGLPHVTIELRQDELTSASGRERWARELHGALRRVAAQLLPGHL